MPISQFTLRFNGDGTLDSIPSNFRIIPGVDFTVICRVDEVVSGATTPEDLTDARIFFQLISGDTQQRTGLFYEGEPAIVLTNPKGGIFTINFTAAMTDHLRPGAYTWEIKAVLPSGAVRRIGYVDQVTVAPTMLADLR